jgi:lysophospholipase L1-like esterase
MRPFLLAIPLLLLLVGCASGDSSDGRSEPGLYIALGDSLSEGVGASNRSKAFVPLVHAGLGEAFELQNLGHSGDTSGDLVNHDHLAQAIREVEQRNRDDDTGNDVKLVTLEIGGNDLLELTRSPLLAVICLVLEEALTRSACVNALEDTLDRFEVNLTTALDRLQDADPELTIVVMTLYNPFSGGIEAADELAEVALEGQVETPVPEGLNDIIRSEVEDRGLILVEWYPLFVGKAGEYIADDVIHPNDAGHGVMADAVLEAVRP